MSIQDPSVRKMMICRSKEVTQLTPRKSFDFRIPLFFDSFILFLSCEVLCCISKLNSLTNIK